MFRYSFKILPDRLKLIRLYPCGSLGQSNSFVFGARVGHFAATPQSDVVGIWSRGLGVMATLLVRQKMPFFFSCIYNPQITVSPTSSFSAKSCQKSPLTLYLSFKFFSIQQPARTTNAKGIFSHFECASTSSPRTHPRTTTVLLSLLQLLLYMHHYQH